MFDFFEFNSVSPLNNNSLSTLESLPAALKFQDKTAISEPPKYDFLVRASCKSWFTKLIRGYLFLASATRSRKKLKTFRFLQIDQELRSFHNI